MFALLEVSTYLYPFQACTAGLQNKQKVRHGERIAEPEAPLRPGYTLQGWVAMVDSQVPWDFATPVDGDMTLYALWQPAAVTVKFDLAGGRCRGADTLPEQTVVYGEPYGALPQPEKDGAVFAGWQYSGSAITAESTVAATGEHVLTAAWK